MVTRCACGHQRFGYRIENSTPSKIVEGSRHMLRIPRVWAIQKEILDYHLKEIIYVEIKDAESGICYRMTREDFRRAAFVIDRGDGEQYAVALKYWQRYRSDIKQLELEL